MGTRYPGLLTEGAKAAWRGSFGVIGVWLTFAGGDKVCPSVERDSAIWSI